MAAVSLAFNPFGIYSNGAEVKSDVLSRRLRKSAGDNSMSSGVFR